MWMESSNPLINGGLSTICIVWIILCSTWLKWFVCNYLLSVHNSNTFISIVEAFLNVKTIQNYLKESYLNFRSRSSFLTCGLLAEWIITHFSVAVSMYSWVGLRFFSNQNLIRVFSLFYWQTVITWRLPDNRVKIIAWLAKLYGCSDLLRRLKIYA